MSKLRAALAERRMLEARVQKHAMDARAASAALRRHYRRHCLLLLGIAASGGVVWGKQHWRPPQALQRNAVKWGRILLAGLL